MGGICLRAAVPLGVVRAFSALLFIPCPFVCSASLAPRTNTVFVAQVASSCASSSCSTCSPCRSSSSPPGRSSSRCVLLCLLPRARSLWNAVGINRVDGRHGHPCGPCGSDVLGAPWERRCEHTAGRRWHAEFVDRKSRFLVSWWGECGHARRAPVPRRCLARRSGSIDGHAPYDLVLRASEAKRASSTLRCCKLNL